MKSISTRRALRNRLLGAAVSAALLALPASAAAEYYVPPGNSAVNQYTESVPSAGGESSKGKNHQAPVPAKALGGGNAKKLESKGAVGTKTAELAAATAPPTELDEAAGLPAEASAEPAGGKGQGKDRHKTKGKHQSKSKEGKAGSGGGGSGAGSGGGAGSPTATPSYSANPGGSGATGQVLGQATGLGGDGNLGIWLPLVILAAVAGSLVYRFRPGNRPTA